MKIRVFLLSALLLALLPALLPALLLAQEAVQKSVSVTVYNNNLGVVRDVRSIDLQKGIQDINITGVAQKIDATSVHINLDADVLEQNYQYDLVNLSKILSKYIDKNIELIDKKGRLISGKLLSIGNSQIVLEKKEGGLLMLPNIGDYQISVSSLPEGLITKPTLVWTIKSDKSGESDAVIEYQTGGMNWHAEYVALLNKSDSKMDFNSWVSIENKSGAAYKNATLKLIAGDVNRVKNNPQIPVYAVYKGEVADESRGQVSEKSFFEYHLYRLERPTDILNNETKQVSLFETKDIPVEKKFYYFSYGSNVDNGKAQVVVEFANKKKNGLGIPLPKGKVRVYKNDGETVEFIGEDLIDHTPENDEIKLKIGDAFDIKIKEIQTKNKRLSERSYELSYKLTILNSKKDDIILNVERSMPRNWEMISSSVKYEKKNSGVVVFKVPAKAGETTTMTYTYRYTY